MDGGLLPSYSLLAAASQTLGGSTVAIACAILGALFLGACFGSFANACALRLVRNEDFIRMKSRCRMCELPLKPWENVPIIGYLMLRGRCSCSKFMLPLRYLLLEIIAGLIVLGYAIFMPPIMAIGFSIAAIFIIISFLTDLDAMVLHPSLLTILGGLGLGLATTSHTGLFYWHITWQEAAAATLLGAVMPFTINKIYLVLRGKNGFGEGDFWLLAAIGAWIGPIGVVTVFFGAAFLGAITGISLIVIRKANLGSKLPFGLFLNVVFILCSNLYMLLN